MMENPQQTIDGAVEAVLCGCINCISVPLSVLQLDLDKPIGGWEPLFAELNIKILTDHVGRRSVTAAAARQLLKTARRRDELAVEQAERLAETRAARHPVRAGGVPMVEGASPYESLVAAGGVVSPRDEFRGHPKTTFLQDALLAGERAQAEEKRLAEERAKERLAEQMTDKLR